MSSEDKPKILASHLVEGNIFTLLEYPDDNECSASDGFRYVVEWDRPNLGRTTLLKTSMSQLAIQWFVARTT